MDRTATHGANLSDDRALHPLPATRSAPDLTDSRRLLWWGRADPNYSRNAILRQALTRLGWSLTDFRPRFSVLGDLEARGLCADLVWVPCFRQRDMLAAARWACRHRLPLVFDPLISAYDKQVYERGKRAPDSQAAHRLLRREQRRFAAADRVLADTVAHAAFFHEVLDVPRERLTVVPVGADEALFRPQPPPTVVRDRLEVLFFGSFLPLQGSEIIAAAIRRYRGLPVHWRLVGDGPLLARTRKQLHLQDSVSVEGWLPYTEIPACIARADVVLGVFGTTPKAGRVIPNKVYQALACGRPVITRTADAYPAELRARSDSGLLWVPAGDPDALARAVADLAAAREHLPRLAAQALATYRERFDSAAVLEALRSTLSRLTGAAN